MLSFYTEDISYRLTRVRLHRKWLKAVIHSHKKQAGHISFILTSNARILEINKEYLNHSYFTDVISFDYNEGEKISGDIFISIEKVRENASYYKVRTGEELRRVMVHGVLHLLGFNDASEAEIEVMRNMENEALHLWLKEDGNKNAI